MLKTKKFTLNDKPVKISQASWDMVMLRTELEEQAKAETRADHMLDFFAKNLYPSLAACTIPTPTLENAYAADLDKWYLAVRELNKSWFEDIELTQEEITFSDKKKITVLSKRPSTIMQMERLSYESTLQPTLENPRREIFRSIYYPQLAGCSIGEVPDPDTARSEMSADDLQIWYDAAARQNPDWFLPLEQIAKANEAEQLKKKTSADRGTTLP